LLLYIFPISFPEISPAQQIANQWIVMLSSHNVQNSQKRDWRILRCTSCTYHDCVTQPGKISFNQVASRAECLSIRAAFRMGSSYVEERIWSDCRDGNNSRRTRLINSVVRRNIILPPPSPLLRRLFRARTRARIDTNKSPVSPCSILLRVSRVVRFDLFNRPPGSEFDLFRLLSEICEFSPPT